MSHLRQNFPPNALGFTLVEITFVVVILGIIAVIGSSFVASALESYRTAQARNQLVQRGRLSLEQMAREMRMALPNAVRVSAGGRCIEFMPVVGAANYQGAVADTSNNIAAQNQVATGTFTVYGANPRHVVIAPFSPADVYTSGTPAARVGLGALGTGPYNAVPFSGSHRFIRNSLNRRLYLTADPVRFCVSGGNLVRFYDYGFSGGALSEGDPGGSNALMAHNVEPNGVAFALSPGSENRNMAVLMHLIFRSGSASLDLSHQVLIRNVP
jgi:MSHA biogenesis protein MshO